MHTFKENDRVSVVAGSSNYKGKHSGRIGTVMHVYENNSSGNIAVLLDNVWNDSSGKGWFYFKESDLRIFYDLKVDFQQATPQKYLYTVIDGSRFSVDSLSGIDTTTTKITTKMNVNGDNENVKSEKILDLWKKAGMEFISENASRAHEVLMAADQTCAKIRNCVAEIDRIIAESGNNEIRFSNNFDCERFVSDGTMQKIAESRSKMIDRKKDLNALVDEIAAMLSACDTYEQEMDVLRTYNVIDEDGRLNKTFTP